MWLLFLCSRPSDRSGPGCVSTDRNVRSKCRCSNVSCSSHYDAQLTAFFIDPRAKWSTVQGNGFVDIEYQKNIMIIIFCIITQKTRRSSQDSWLALTREIGTNSKPHNVCIYVRTKQTRVADFDPSKFKFRTTPQQYPRVVVVVAHAAVCWLRVDSS